MGGLTYQNQGYTRSMRQYISAKDYYAELHFVTTECEKILTTEFSLINCIHNSYIIGLMTTFRIFIFLQRKKIDLKSTTKQWMNFM